MSGQQSNSGTPCRVPKTPPNSGKQGPMKATIPISGVVKPSSNVRSGKSPIPGPPVSPSFSWRSRASPDHTSGQRSPGSSSYKGKSKYSGGPSEVMRRTASLDTIYLKGHWPRDHFYFGHMGTLQVDKATQTDDGDLADLRKIHCISETEEKFSLRPKLRGNKEPNSRHVSPGDHTLNTSSQTLASCILSPTLKMNPVNIPCKQIPKSSIRSSVEGLNQEIERIVLRTGCEGHSGDRYGFRQATPEGHRAPLAELLRSNRSRSVNTQTPQDFSHSSGIVRPCKVSPKSFMVLLHPKPKSSPVSFLDREKYYNKNQANGPQMISVEETGESHGSSPDNETGKLGTSPHINKFLAREPPDGCEKVRLKSQDETTNIMLEHAIQPSTFKLRPSLGSAFKILQPAPSPSKEQVEPRRVPHGDEATGE